MNLRVALARTLRARSWIAVVAAGVLLIARPYASGAESETARTPAARTPAPREALLFRNGDRLYGVLESVAPKTGVRWRHADVEEAIEFTPENITEIQFPARPRVPVTSTNTCRLQLWNRDELEGVLQSFDGEQAILLTWYAGTITVPRASIQSLVPVPPEGATVFEGPSGLQGWTIGKVVSALGDAGEWKYRHGAFYATNAASIARDLNIPDEAVVEFDLAWRGVFQLAVAIYTDYMQPINLANKDTEPEFAGFYSLQLNSFSANLLPVKKNDPLRYLGQVSVPAFNQKNAAHVEVRASKSKRSVSLLVDGQLIKQWVDSEGFAGQGRGVRFVHQGQGRIKLSHLRISEWNGQLEEEPVGASDGKQEVVKLRNGDKAAGTISRIEDGKVSLTIGQNKLAIPLSRVRRIDLAKEAPNPAATDPGTVRAIFNRGGAVTFKLERWQAGKVMGSSPNFGRLTFDPAAFSRVELRLKGD